MSERLERQSETNSEYSNSFAEDYDFEEIEEEEDDDEDEGDEDLETEHRYERITNGDVPTEHEHISNGVRRPNDENSPLRGSNGLNAHQRPQHQLHSHLLSAHSPPSLRVQHSQQHHRQSNPHGSGFGPNLSPPTSTASRSSLQQLRQQLPPPPPRPVHEGRQEPRNGDRNSVDGEQVDNWLDLNFKPDSYNC